MKNNYVLLIGFYLASLVFVWFIASSKEADYDSEIDFKNNKIEELSGKVDSLKEVKTKIDTIVIYKQRFIENGVEVLKQDTFTFHSLPVYE